MNQEHPNLGLTARGVREDELEAYLGLMCRAFHLDFAAARPIFYTDPFYDISLKRVLFDETSNRIVSALTLVPADLRLPSGATVPVAGIAGVCTEPALQRRGHGRALLEATLAELPALGFPLAALTADAPELYRRLGFEFCSASVSWRAKIGSLPQIQSDIGQARLFSQDEWQRAAPLLRSLYDQTVGAKPGIFSRDSRRWANIESPGARRSLIAWKDQDSVAAYAIFQEKPDATGIDLEILEMVSPTEAGCQALMGFLVRRRGVASIHCQMRPSDFHRFGLDTMAGIESRTGLGMLARVTDLEPIFAAANHGQWGHLLANSKSGLTIRVSEPGILGGRQSLRLFAVTDLAGNVRSMLAPSDEVIGDWISLGNHALAQLMTGFRGARQLSTQKLLRSSGEGALVLAEQLFPQSELFLGPLDAF